MMRERKEQKERGDRKLDDEKELRLEGTKRQGDR